MITRRSLLRCLPAVLAALVPLSRSQRVSAGTLPVEAVPGGVTTLTTAESGWERNAWYPVEGGYVLSNRPAVDGLEFHLADGPDDLSIWVNGDWIGDAGPCLDGSWWATTVPDDTDMVTGIVGLESVDEAVMWLRAESGA